MEEEKKEGKITVRIPKINVWILISLVLTIALVLSLLRGWGVTGKATGTLSAEEAGKKAIDYINNNLVQPGTNASMVSTKDLGSVYEVVTSYQGQQISIYITKDGGYLFLSAYDTSENIEQEQQTIGNFLVSKDGVCKEDNKPIIYLFGTNTCPHCRWEHPIINNVTSKFESYISYHDNIDTEKDGEIFSKYSSGGIPTLVLGCKYYRVGSGESIGQEQETKVLTALICKLTENKPSSVCNEVQDLIKQIE